MDASTVGLALAALLSTYADTQSTKDMLKRGGKETNPLLGEKPSGEKLDQTGLLAAATGLTGVSLLPEKYRKGALGAWAGLESGLTMQNQKVTKEGRTRSFGEELAVPSLLAALGYALGDSFNEVGVAPSPANQTPSLTFEKKF